MGAAAVGGRRADGAAAQLAGAAAAAELCHRLLGCDTREGGGGSSVEREGGSGAEDGATASTLSASFAPLVASATLWLLLQLLRFRGAVRYLAGCALGPWCVSSRFYMAPYDELEPTTEGIRYDDVPLVKNYDIARYRGLAATRMDESGAGWAPGWSADDLESRWRRLQLGQDALAELREREMKRQNQI